MTNLGRIGPVFLPYIYIYKYIYVYIYIFYIHRLYTDMHKHYIRVPLAFPLHSDLDLTASSYQITVTDCPLQIGGYIKHHI